jgi:heat shock protein HtpX
MNLKTGMLMTALTALLIFVGYGLDLHLNYNGFIYIFFIMSIGMNLITYWYSDKIVLAMYKAKEVSPQQAPWLHEMVERLAASAKLPKPKVYIIPTDAPNAFATGRSPKHAAVAVTEGITRLLTNQQLEGVLAHEMAHVKNRDTLISTMAAIIAGMVMMLSRLGFFLGFRSDDDGGGAGAILMMILAPIAAILIQMAISRAREFKADEAGARICGNPMPLAEALKQLEKGAKTRPMHANASTAHLFIVNPLKGGGIGRLFSTHPTTQERVNRLVALGRKMGRGY